MELTPSSVHCAPASRRGSYPALGSKPLVKSKTTSGRHRRPQGGTMNPEPLRIVHITDTHILAEPGAELYGVDSFTALASLLAVMQRDAWTPHLLIATGDLSQDGSAASYQRLRSLLTSLGLPVYCIPGNHDALSEMHTHLRGGPIHLERRVVWDPWQIVLLDSQLPGEGHGHLSRGELTALAEVLRDGP